MQTAETKHIGCFKQKKNYKRKKDNYISNYIVNKIIILVIFTCLHLQILDGFRALINFFIVFTVHEGEKPITNSAILSSLTCNIYIN